MNNTKIDTEDLDSPRQELSVRGLGFVVTLLFRESIFCVRILEEQCNCRLKVTFCYVIYLAPLTT